ncbi:MAG: PTS transporter subunit EIIA [Gemmatimonadetes bacterium]|jgi:PTS system nitrogen regulatory IIA component|nr:PTS transporter subunit EIIA [Gemmatimonadota bacterium]MBT5325465.1 PTS transporter subunit EIIA [Gemmatimonadota bacterium]MBT5450290.1 PTS transporter subunit EIIA [Gemmatimonadota bacterium]MBT5804969.1 PTS transporter subunit EIIA [Gemmatimonadota bacterium]MBT6619143.1 PTS transporter subunit EIIA [Gemmatimonadota bacterium]
MPPAQLRILVPLENPDQETALVDLAASLATPPWGELHLTHVVTASDTTPQSDIRTVLERQASKAISRNIGALIHLTEGEDVTTEIQQAIRRWSCNMMLMAWNADVDRDAILASENRALTKDIDVDTLIFKEKESGPVRRILVPFGGGNHSLMGVQIAYDLAKTWGAELEILRIARDPICDLTDPILQRYCSQLTKDTHLQLELLGIHEPLTVIPSVDVVTPIVERAKGRDLVVLGASNDWRHDEHLAGSIPDEIAYEVPCSVLMVRSAAASGLQLSRIFWEHTVRLDLAPKDKWDAITLIIDALIEEKQIPAGERGTVLEAALAREHKGSTSLGHGTAIPHAPIPDLPGIIGCLAICPQGVDFEGPTDEPTQFIFLLLTPEQNYRSYIPILAQIATLMRNGTTRGDMLAAQTPSEITAILKRLPAP